jgi:hypothetical protein
MRYCALLLLSLLFSCKKQLILGHAFSVEDRVSYIANEYDGDTLPHLHDTQLEEAGLLKNGSIVGSRFLSIPRHIALNGNSLSPFHVVVAHSDKNKKPEGKIYAGDTVFTPLAFPETIFCTADVIPGGYKELVFYNEYYIVNGTNYTIDVYEITD